MTGLRKLANSLLAACDSPVAPVYAFVVHSAFLVTIVAAGLGSAISFTALALLFRLAKIVVAKCVKSDYADKHKAWMRCEATLEIEGEHRTVTVTLPSKTIEALRRIPQEKS